MTRKINVKNTEINIISLNNEDYISLTDMLEAKDGGFFISDWLRNRNTVEFLGVWERLYNLNFNYGEYAIIKNHDKKGNIRDYANVTQLICLSNLENLNAFFINEKFPQNKRLIKLNKIAIHQMKLLTQETTSMRLDGGDGK